MTLLADVVIVVCVLGLIAIFTLLFLSIFAVNAHRNKVGFVATVVEKEDEVARMSAWTALDMRLAHLVRMYDLEVVKLEKHYPCLGLVVTGEDADLCGFREFVRYDPEITVEFIEI